MEHHPGTIPRWLFTDKADHDLSLNHRAMGSGTHSFSMSPLIPSEDQSMPAAHTAALNLSTGQMTDLMRSRLVGIQDREAHEDQMRPLDPETTLAVHPIVCSSKSGVRVPLRGCFHKDYAYGGESHRMFSCSEVKCGAGDGRDVAEALLLQMSNAMSAVTTSQVSADCPARWKMSEDNQAEAAARLEE
jgi:hypothetical protein